MPIATDAASEALPQAPRNPENPHKPRLTRPVRAAKVERAVPLDPAQLLGEEALIQSLAQFEDPHAQPELPVDVMDYTPGALEYRYGTLAQGRLFGADGAPNFHDVRVNLSKDGALGAALAAVAASSPAHLAKLIGPARLRGLVRGSLYSRATPGAQYALVVDQQVPLRQDGAPMGHSETRHGPVTLWPLLLAKMIAKLDQVLVQARGTSVESLNGRDSLDTPRTLADIAAFLQTLSGAPVHTAARDPQDHHWSAALRILLNSTRPLAAVATFRDTQSVGRMECDDGVLTNAFGGLGMHVVNQRTRTNVVLLAKHHYAVVAVEPGQQRVQLYNPLGWNPDPKALAGGNRALRFWAPEQLDSLPKAPGTFWVTASLLERIGMTLSLSDLPLT